MTVADAVSPGGAEGGGDEDAAADRVVAHHELAVHLFAPTGGPGAQAAYAYLLGVWDGCRSRLGMDREIAAVGLPAEPPPDLAAFTAGGPAEAAVAACGRPRSAGVVQALLRRHRDVACLSVMLAPTAEDGFGWAGLDRLWSQAVGPVPPELVGAARLYLARLADPAPRRVEPTPELARAVAAGLPAGRADEGWAGRGTATASGFAVWEPAAGPDERAERRLVVLAPGDADAALSAWVWSRGTAEATPFARYLLHAAKVRYQMRVWGDGRAVRELREQVDAATGALAGLLDPYRPDGAAEAQQEAAGGPAGPTAEHLHRLWAGLSHLTRVHTALTEMCRSVEIARWNMRETAASEVPAAGRAPGRAARGVFGDDDALAEWFAHRLDDDRVFAAAAAERARDLLGYLTCRTLLARGPDPGPAIPDVRVTPAGDPCRGDHRPAGRPRAAPPPADDDAGTAETDDYAPLPSPERGDLLYALAEVFTADGAAALVLDHVGLPRCHRRAIGSTAPLLAWSDMLRTMDDGAVATPHRSLLEAALRIFPHNPTFRRLARRYGLRR